MQVAVLLQDETSTKVFSKYIDYIDVFLSDLAMKSSENTRINEHAIELEKDKQPPYRPIYSLNLIKLETLRTYIKTYLKTEFI